MRHLLLMLAFLALPAFGEEENTPEKFMIMAADVPADAPRFEQYPVKAAFRGVPAKPDVRSHPRSRLFRTMIRRGAQEGPNFAGHYTLVTWGCGTGCVGVAIVDAVSGKVFHPANLDTAQFMNIDDSLWGSAENDGFIKYRRNSKLLIVMGGINEDDALRGISYFVWEHGQLKRIRFVHKPYE